MDEEDMKNIRIAENSLNPLKDKLGNHRIGQEIFLKPAGIHYFRYIKIE